MESLKVKLEGPQNGCDRSYKWIDKIAALREIERGIPVEQFCQVLQKMNITEEFNLLCKITQLQEHQSSLLRISKRYSHLNRYADIVPYCESRVELMRLRIPPLPPNCILDEEEIPDEIIQSYINASFIHSALADDSLFIASQAPVTHTLEDFWTMVLERDVGLIFMLCQLTEYGKSKCGEYFPQSLESPELRLGQRLSITLEGIERISDNLILRLLRVREFTELRRGKLVKQFQFVAWPDHSAPQQAQFADIRHMVDTAVAHVIAGPSQSDSQLGTDLGGRILIHCSAGIGRTGTLIALINIQLALERMLAQESEDPSLQPRISVFAIVRRLREQRYQMVQSTVQYSFIHDYFRLVLQNGPHKN